MEQNLLDLSFDNTKFSSSQKQILNGLNEIITAAEKIEATKINIGGDASFALLNQKLAEQAKQIEALKQANVEYVKTQMQVTDATKATVTAVIASNSELESNLALRQKLQAQNKSWTVDQKEDLQLLKNNIITRAEYNLRIIESTRNIEGNKVQISDLSKVIKQQSQDNVNSIESIKRKTVAEEQAMKARDKQADSEIKAVRAIMNDKQAQTKADATASKEREREAAIDKKIQNELSSEYKQAQLAYNVLQQKAKDYYFQLGAGHPVTIQAAKDADVLYTKLKEADALVGQHNKNVGNYPGALSGALGKVGSTIKEIANTALMVAGVGTGIFGLEQFFSRSVEEANKAEAANTRLANTLSNIGRSDIFDRLKYRVDELTKTFTYLNKADVTEVFGKLITYGKLTENQISQLTPVILDFAAKNKIDVVEATSLVLKSLEGNARSLKEYGINMKEGKDVTERFGLIMSDLAPRVAGAGEAFGKTFPGQLAITKEEIIETEKEIGGKLIPIFSKLLSFVSPAISAITKYFDLLDQFSPAGVRAGASFGNEAMKHLEEVRNERQKLVDDLLKPTENKSDKDIQLFSTDLKKKIDAMESQRALARVTANTAVEATLTDSITVYKQALSQLQSANTVLGHGGKVDKVDKPATDETAAILKAEQDRLKALSAMNKLELELIAKTEKAISDDQSNNFGIRLLALQSYAQTKTQIVANDQKLELQELKNKLNEIAKIEGISAGKRTAEQKKLLIEKEAFLAQEKLAIFKGTIEVQTIQVDLVDKMREMRKKEADRIDKEEKDKVKAIEATAKAEMESRKRVAADTESLKKTDAIRDELVALQALNEEYAKGLLTVTEYNEKKTELSRKSTIAMLMAEQDALRERYKAARDAGDNITKLYEELAAKELAIEKASARSTIQTDTETTKKRIDSINSIVSYENEAAHLLEGLSKAAYQDELNRIQGLKDAQDSYYSKQAENIRNSSLTEEKKAAQLAILKNQQETSDIAFNKRKRDAQNKQAEFEKKIALFQIVINTAAAVVKALIDPGGVEGVALSIAEGVKGAVEFAIAAATPVPHYKDGTPPGGHKGGIARWAEGNVPEEVKEPGKPAYIAYNDTTGYLPAGTIVTPLTSEYVNAKARDGATRLTGKMGERRAERNEAWDIARWQSRETRKALLEIAKRPIKNTLIVREGLNVNKVFGR